MFAGHLCQCSDRYLCSEIVLMEREGRDACNCLSRCMKRRGSGYIKPSTAYNVLMAFIPQASQAAQEAEDNARKAKNSVNSLLAVINDLLDQLGKAVPFSCLLTGKCWQPA